MIRRIRLERPVAALVRIASLIAAGDNGVRRQTSGAQNRGIDFRAQNLRGQTCDPTTPASFPGPVSTACRTSIARAIPLR